MCALELALGRIRHRLLRALLFSETKTLESYFKLFLGLALRTQDCHGHQSFLSLNIRLAILSFVRCSTALVRFLAYV